MNSEDIQKATLRWPFVCPPPVIADEEPKAWFCYCTKSQIKLQIPGPAYMILSEFI